MTSEERLGVNELVGKLNTKEDEIVQLEKENADLKELLEACKQERVEALYRNEQYIKENAELKDKLNNLASVAEVRLGNWQKYAKACDETQELLDKQIEATYKVVEKLTEAKDLIKNIICVIWGEGWNYSLDWKVKAEAFLEEE